MKPVGFPHSAPDQVPVHCPADSPFWNGKKHLSRIVALLLTENQEAVTKGVVVTDGTFAVDLP